MPPCQMQRGRPQTVLTDAGPGSSTLPAARLLCGPMLQSLLEDRFQLKIHREVEQAPMYPLTVAKTGFKRKPIQDGECVLLAPGQGMRMIGADDKPYCGWVGWPIHGPNRTLLGGGIATVRLAQSLAMFVLDRNAIDRTGIAGSFLIRLEYNPDENTRCFGGPEFCKVDPNSDFPPAPAIFNAMERQLGLELERIQGPMEHIGDRSSGAAFGKLVRALKIEHYPRRRMIARIFLSTHPPVHAAVG